jgi:hypothetical protein
MYCIFITYLVVLYQLWCLYHSYVGEATKVKILWHYNGSLGSSSNHSSCFFRELDLPSTIQHVAITFLGCWALIALILIFPFQHDHLTLLDTVAHVKIGIPFQVALRNTRAMLFEVVWSHVLPFESLLVQILSSNATFLDTLTIWTRIYFTSDICFFKCCATTSPLLCKSNSKGLIIGSS